VAETTTPIHALITARDGSNQVESIPLTNDDARGYGGITTNLELIAAHLVFRLVMVHKVLHMARDMFF
jgi:hypothetical protein